ncbi:hypothetical protein ACGFZB_12435 [Streptomyces cinerochromogenes]|uniref:SH3b domain-containing protein n=1 Tax=Streptomyces cinerochromogenes TaxID=66422 RepID=A0ABW7B247_9ACTN
MGSIRMRGTALLLAGVSLFALVGTAGCEKQDPSASFTPAFVPVTFTLDASGKISVSVGKNFVTPIGTFSVNTGVEHQFDIHPKGYLTAVIRYVDRKLGLVESGYLVHTDHKVEPSLDGVPLAPAKGILRADFTRRGTGGTLKISDTRQNTPVPTATASASSCPDSGSLTVTLPEVSAGDSVADTVAELSAACLTVQYATEPAGQDDGTVTRVVIPTAPGGSVQLPPVADGDPGPGDEVTASTAQAATVYVSGPDVPPSPSATGGTPSPTDTASPEATPTDTPDAVPTDTGAATVHADAGAPVRSAPSTTGERVGGVVAGADYPAVCVQQGDEVTAHGRTSGAWVRLRLADGGTGFVTATALTGEPTTLAPC